MLAYTRLSYRAFSLFPRRTLLTRAPTCSFAHPHIRLFSTKPGGIKSPEEVRSSYGKTTLRAMLVFAVTGGALLIYFDHEKKNLKKKHEQEISNRALGKPKIGGPFDLIDQDGMRKTDKDFRGKFLLVYFGFTHCPDVCPEEMDKMAKITDQINNDPELGGAVLTPIFITCDPNRDKPEIIKQYIRDFHPDIIGLTGSTDQIRAIAKAYRVYVSAPSIEGKDYLVDHSIFIYLMDPEGKFVDCFTKDTTDTWCTQSVKRYVMDYLHVGGSILKGRKV